MLVLENRWLITEPQQEQNYKMGIECIAFDTQDLTKLGTPKKVCIKQVNGKVELVIRVNTNLSNYEKLPLVSILPTHLMASKEESKLFIDNPDVIIERVLSSGAKFTREEYEQAPKEAKHLMLNEDGDLATINVKTSKEYQKYGIKSQLERGVARVLVGYCANAEEMKKLSKEDRAKNYFMFDNNLVEYNDYLKINPNYRK